VSHETSDIKLKPIGVAIVIFIVAAVVIHVGVWFLFDYFRDQQQRRDVRRSMIEARPAIPPQPRLQVDPYKDWRDFRQSQQTVLETYDWASREQGRVRIPIRRAMELLAEQEKAK
jgi:hypothetical protein